MMRLTAANFLVFFALPCVKQMQKKLSLFHDKQSGPYLYPYLYNEEKKTLLCCIIR